jgi:proline iminopeptidase
MATADVNGTTLHYTRIGSGRTALVLHGGLGLDQSLYRSLDPLASQLELIYYDHRGNGRSGRPSLDTLTMQQWADDGADLAAQLSDDDKVVIIGHSYGGFIAQELALRHPDRVAALVLLATAPGQLGTDEEPAPEGPPVPAEFEEMLTSMPETDVDYAAALGRLFSAYFHGPVPVGVERQLEATIFDAASMRRGFEELGSWSSVDRLHTLEMPALLVVGRHDAFTAVPQSDRIAQRLPNAEMVVLEHSGHFPWLEEPEEFFAVTSAWIDTHVQ